MSSRSMPHFAGLILGIFVMTTSLAGADALKDEIAPTGKLRVAIGISAVPTLWKRATVVANAIPSSDPAANPPSGIASAGAIAVLLLT